jgi:hypothetical protein
MFLFVGATAQEAKVNLTDKLSVHFPAQPVKQVSGPSSIYSLKLPDSTANFTALVTNLQEANGLNADVLEAAMAQPGFWDQVEAGFMQSLGSEAKAVSRALKSVEGKETLELVVERPASPGAVPSTLTVYILMDGVNTINLVHNNRNGNADDAMKAKFLSSLAVVPK